MRDKLGSSAGVCIYICVCECACGCALRRQILFICLKAERRPRQTKGEKNECIFLDSTFKDFTELTSCHRLQDPIWFLKSRNVDRDVI